jgi:hypothetical protein
VGAIGWSALVCCSREGHAEEAAEERVELASQGREAGCDYAYVDFCCAPDG